MVHWQCICALAQASLSISWLRFEGSLLMWLHGWLQVSFLPSATSTLVKIISHSIRSPAKKTEPRSKRAFTSIIVKTIKIWFPPHIYVLHPFLMLTKNHQRSSWCICMTRFLEAFPRKYIVRCVSPASAIMKLLNSSGSSSWPCCSRTQHQFPLQTDEIDYRGDVHVKRIGVLVGNIEKSP